MKAKLYGTGVEIKVKKEGMGGILVYWEFLRI